MTSKNDFLSGLVVVFKEQIHTDIQLHPGGDGPSIPAHKAVLAARSKVFRTILDSDGFKGSTREDTLTLSELSYEELESLLVFLYSGALPAETMNKHVRALYLAADKYEIPYLQEHCRSHFLESLSSSNALDFLELSNIPSDTTLKDAALSYIVKHMEEIVCGTDYESFVQRNPHLSVQITRAFLNENKTKKAREATTAPSSILNLAPARTATTAPSSIFNLAPARTATTAPSSIFNLAQARTATTAPSIFNVPSASSPVNAASSSSFGSMFGAPNFQYKG